ncbi:MAG: hypothetical protein QG596_1841 [Actinomycetota bacterium]|jgi:hypothetical protein|nr:hypothetical protein [Actinomycetota bacterium]
MVGRLRSTQGQATVEWLGLVLFLSCLMAAVLTAGVRIPGAAFVHSLSTKMLCAASLSGSCAGEGSLDAAYGSELAELVRAGTPTLMYGPDMLGLPVDYRTCRSPWCAEGPGDGEVIESTAGEPVTLFTRVVEKGSSKYIQYWAYYPESASLRGVPVLEEKGFHPHDWESLQVRIESDGTVSQRASSHAGYNHGRSVTNWGSDAGWGFVTDATEAVGLRESGGWGEATGTYLIAGGSHAGNVDDDINRDDYPAYTPASRVRLVPLESIKDGPLSRPARFDPITAPWNKQVWTDPQAEGTG